MKLSGLAFCTYVFDKISGKDKRYREFLDNINKKLNLKNEKHIDALLVWLNQWGCRINEEDFPRFKKEIKKWFKKYGVKIPNKVLMDLGDRDYNDIDEIYAELLKVKGFGHTITSKILFAASPDTFPPWDGAVRGELEKRGHIDGTYFRYLKYAREKLDQLSSECKKQGFRINDLPKKLGRPISSLAKLIDEFHHVEITVGITPPPSDVVRTWIVFSKVDM